MFKILKGGRVFSPDEQGVRDVLIAGRAVAQIAESIEPAVGYGPIEVVDVRGKYVVPGFIDQHVHLIGGGGEGGFATRTPEVMLSNVIQAGSTTVVGCLGTDGVTRSMTALLAKARGLELEGLTTYIYTGSYQVPPNTVTGSIRSDIVIVDKILGCGEIAVSDHRSAQPTKNEITRLAAEARVGGMLSGKAGVLHLHMGDGARKLSMLFAILDEAEIPVTQFTPTHINRNPELLTDGIRFAKLGGYIDMTSGIGGHPGSLALRASRAIKHCLDNGVAIDRITMSSDGNGSMPFFNERGETTGLTVSRLDSLHHEFCSLVEAEGVTLAEALRVVTVNPAKSLKLYPQKGTLQAGSDADILVLDAKLGIDSVFAKGRCMMADGQAMVKGTFE